MEIFCSQDGSAEQRLEHSGTADGPELRVAKVNLLFWREASSCYRHTHILTDKMSHRTVYTDDCLGPGNLKMVKLAKKVFSPNRLREQYMFY